MRINHTLDFTRWPAVSLRMTKLKTIEQNQDAKHPRSSIVWNLLNSVMSSNSSNLIKCVALKTLSEIESVLYGLDQWNFVWNRSSSEITTRSDNPVNIRVEDVWKTPGGDNERWPCAHDLWVLNFKQFLRRRKRRFRFTSGSKVGLDAACVNVRINDALSLSIILKFVWTRPKIISSLIISPPR